MDEKMTPEQEAAVDRSMTVSLVLLIFAQAIGHVDHKRKVMRQAAEKWPDGYGENVATTVADALDKSFTELYALANRLADETHEAMDAAGIPRVVPQAESPDPIYVLQPPGKPVIH